MFAVFLGQAIECIESFVVSLPCTVSFCSSNIVSGMNESDGTSPDSVLGA
jgi:hypothetical protein